MPIGKRFSSTRTMACEASNPTPEENLTQLASALGDIRDSFVMISLVLKDLVAEAPSATRDAVMNEVDYYLRQFQETPREK